MKDFFAFVIKGLRPHRKMVLFCSALAFTAALLDMAAPILLGRSFDLASKHAAFIMYGAAIFGWFLIGVVADRIRTFLSGKGQIIGYDVTEVSETETLKHLVRKTLAFHYGKHSQDSIRAVHDLSNSLANVIQGVVFDLLPALLTIAASFVYLLIIDWRIAGILAASVAALLAYSYHSTPSQMAMDEKWYETGRKGSSFAWDSMRSILVVKSTTNESLIGARLDSARSAFMKVVEDYTANERRINNRQNLITKIGTLAIFVFALSNLAAGTFTLGRLATVTAYAFMLFGYVRYTQWQFRSLIKSHAAWRDVQKLLAEPDEDFESGREVALKGDVEFRHVAFRYRVDKPALEDVSLHVYAGQKVAIVGESGEGKTTLVDLISRYYLPQSGEILFDGVPYSEVNLRSLRSQMAYVPQDLSLFHESLKFNIAYGRPAASDEDVREAARLAHLQDFIAGLPDGWDTKVGERGLKLSGGERQRVALARAFLRDPKILILDEPTSNLDSKTEAFIQDSLAELMKGRTTFVIAHRLKTVMHADRILVLKDGRIVEQGTHDELAKKDGSYAALLKAQGTFVQDAV